ncbi:MAG: TIM44-like domain-containing protein [Alphaproteobacteria bacterium]|nr:TIM44-like domain-containing protein [Alphaproteobacteria bacterium]MBV8412773.1 TIM44-like domain-containing protein [Alphaproteobacteria bacterium]
MKFPRWFAVLAALVVLAPVMAPSMADARVGGGTGSGSRGSRTNQAPPPTQTAPTAKPIDRSAQPQQQPQDSQQAQRPGLSTPSPQGGSFFSRHPFLSGLMGGFLGAGLFGLLFGGGFGGMAGMLGLLVQLALIGGLAFLGVRMWRAWTANRSAPRAASYAYGGGTPMPGTRPPQPMAPQPMARLGGMLPGAVNSAGGTIATRPISIVESDYNAFEARLGEIQAAYSAGEVGRLRGLATAEMAGYFAEQLAGNAARGVENKVEAVKLEQGDLSEAWREGNVEYATVAMRFSLVDYTRRLADGRIVEGNDRARTEATELWTFVRDPGGPWLLSAIQQT